MADVSIYGDDSCRIDVPKAVSVSVLSTSNGRLRLPVAAKAVDDAFFAPVTGEELKNCLCVSISIMLTLCFFFGGVVVVPAVEELKNCLCVSISIAEVDGAAAGALDAAGDDLPTVRL